MDGEPEPIEEVFKDSELVEVAGEEENASVEEEAEEEEECPKDAEEKEGDGVSRDVSAAPTSRGRRREAFRVRRG